MYRTLTVLITAALTGCSPANSQPPLVPSISIPEHPHPPTSRTVHILYTCTDGTRSVTMQHGQFGRGAVTSLLRNGVIAGPEVLRKMNAILERFDSILHLYPECHSEEDTLSIYGMIGRARSGVLVGWTPTNARFFQLL